LMPRQGISVTKADSDPAPRGELAEKSNAENGVAKNATLKRGRILENPSAAAQIGLANFVHQPRARVSIRAVSFALTRTSESLMEPLS
jgi:hypothetical protein